MSNDRGGSETDRRSPSSTGPGIGRAAGSAMTARVSGVSWSTVVKIIWWPLSQPAQAEFPDGVRVPARSTFSGRPSAWYR